MSVKLDGTSALRKRVSGSHPYKRFESSNRLHLGVAIMRFMCYALHMPYLDNEAKKEYQRNWYAKRRSDWFKGKVCVDFGSLESLELDHRDPTAKVSHRIWSWTLIRITEETAKCDVRCSLCHHVKTWTADGRTRAEHGSDNRYRAGCRCDECRAAHTALAAEWRAAGRKW